jgi:hypothetical protein
MQDEGNALQMSKLSSRLLRLFLRLESELRASQEQPAHERWLPERSDQAKSMEKRGQSLLTAEFGPMSNLMIPGTCRSCHS